MICFEKRTHFEAIQYPLCKRQLRCSESVSAFRSLAGSLAERLKNQLVPFFVRMNAVLAEQLLIVAALKETAADIKQENAFLHRDAADGQVIHLMPAVDAVDVAEPLQDVLDVFSLCEPVEIAVCVDRRQCEQNGIAAVLAGEADSFPVFLLEDVKRRLGQMFAVRIFPDGVQSKSQSFPPNSKTVKS